MVDHKGKTSNQLFSVLEEWEMVMQGLNIDILPDTTRSKV